MKAQVTITMTADEWAKLQSLAQEAQYVFDYLQHQEQEEPSNKLGLSYVDLVIVANEVSSLLDGEGS